MTREEANKFKSMVYTLGEKSIVYGRRMAICELRDQDFENDGIANDIKADMVELENNIYAIIDRQVG